MIYRDGGETIHQTFNSQRDVVRIYGHENNNNNYNKKIVEYASDAKSVASVIWYYRIIIMRINDPASFKTVYEMAINEKNLIKMGEKKKKNGVLFRSFPAIWHMYTCECVCGVFCVVRRRRHRTRTKKKTCT